MNETPECEQVRPFLAELATGATAGHERAQALRHLVGCAECRQELVELSRVADDLLLLVPQREPPPGFEKAVLRRFEKLTDRPRAGFALRRRLAHAWGGVRRPVTVRPSEPLRRPSVRLAAAAAALVVASGVGASVAYWQGASDRHLAQRYEQTLAAGAAFPQALPVRTGTGSVVGHVFLYEGTPAWATVALTNAPESGDYSMTVIATTGKRYPEGVCTVTAGSGISGYPLPIRIGDIASIELARADLQLTVHP